MHNAYLKGVSREVSSFSNQLEILEAGRDVWYAGQYGNVKGAHFSNIKEEIVASINLLTRRNTNTSNYDWHHVVETQHVAQFLFSGSLEDQKWVLMPTILIHKPEHRFLAKISITMNFGNYRKPVVLTSQLLHFILYRII